jgi:ribonuclease T2
VVHPGGRLLLTQFWDSDVELTDGDDDARETDWTLHGLWPDLCDGSYDQYCGMAPRIENATEVLERHGQVELLQLMERYWIAK